MSEASTIAEALRALHEQRTTAETLVEQALARIAKTQACNAIASIDPARALAEARARDADLAAGRPIGPLHGIPITVKDLFVIEGLPMQAGTRAPLPVFESGDAVAVARLRAAGATILAKTNMHEIALGLTGENSWTGDVRNPHDLERQAGGSSSGSGAAVAAGIGFAALGSDTGGSIRVPASLCGVVGFKPTYGLVPLEGALPLSPTCDHAGPLARTVEDVRLVTEVLAAHSLAIDHPITAPKLGVPRTFLDGRLSAAVHSAFETLINRLRGYDAAIIDVDIPEIELTTRAYTPLVRAEAAYVHRHALETSPEGFSEPVRTSLREGFSLSATNYLAARVLRRRIRNNIASMFDASGIDALILPATPTTAPRLGANMIDLESGPAPHREAQLMLTGPFSMVGVPTICLPFAWIDGLPIGVQVVTPWAEDATALAIAEWIEARSPTFCPEKSLRNAY